MVRPSRCLRMASGTESSSRVSSRVLSKGTLAGKEILEMERLRNPPPSLIPMRTLSHNPPTHSLIHPSLSPSPIIHFPPSPLPYPSPQPSLPRMHFLRVKIDRVPNPTHAPLLTHRRVEIPGAGVGHCGDGGAEGDERLQAVVGEDPGRISAVVFGCEGRAGVSSVLMLINCFC